MKNGDDLTKAVSLLKQILPEMQKRKIPTTPENYAVWYEYINGENKLLNEAIKDLDEAKATFSVDVHRDLYVKYIASAREAAVNKLSETVKEIIYEFLSKIDNEEAGLSHYAETLSALSEDADKMSDISDIRSLISQLLEETKKREEATLSMQSSLESMASEMKKLRAEVARLNSEATTDALTKVNNRRAFDMEIETLVSSCKTESKLMSLLMIDIDHFKAFNDRFGHTIGDKVLRFVATLIKKNVKGNDSVSRFGGEEFAVLLPETDYAGAMTVAENIRERLAKQTLSDSAEKVQLGTITASIGVANYQYDEGSEDLIRRADECMYQAKRNGRNAVVGERQLARKEQTSETFI